MEHSKVNSVKQWPIPKCVKDIRSFLGLAGYYRRFVKDFSKIATPLTHLLHNNVQFVWSDVVQKSFDLLKEAVSSAPVLITPDPSKQYVVTTDASGYATGASLQQDHGQWFTTNSIYVT